MDLIADIGATNARCALVDQNGRIVHSQNYLNADFDALQSLLQTFIRSDDRAAQPTRAALAIAAPVTGDDIAMTNIGWRFSQSELKRALALSALTALNDFEALAYALPLLGSADCHRVGGGQPVPGSTLAVIGPGSGLGVASTVPSGDGWIAIAGEGGHVSVPALNASEAAIVAEHGDPNGHCSAERLLSGPGLVRIHATLARLAGEDAGTLAPADVTDRALSGDAIAVQAFDAFFSILGTVAGNLALTVGARGGVYIAGGIVPRVLDAFARSAFRERFIAKGRYRAYLDAIPTAVITTGHPAFLGLKAALGRT